QNSPFLSYSPTFNTDPEFCLIRAKEKLIQNRHCEPACRQTGNEAIFDFNSANYFEIACLTTVRLYYLRNDEHLSFYL
ncbi:MAG: hypothetical protein NWS46_02990, partial [Cyclobacteriaceae bacterium]|nr:hypothetical protein [Cyclobacteriaceae bacterium]